MEQQHTTWYTDSWNSAGQSPQLYLILKYQRGNNTWIWSQLLEELVQGLEPFESATVYLSGQEYTTASCLPQVVKGLQRCFETSSGKAFLSTAIKGITESWGTLNNTISKKDLEKDPILLAASPDPRYRKMTFMKKKKKKGSSFWPLVPSLQSWQPEFSAWPHARGGVQELCSWAYRGLFKRTKTHHFAACRHSGRWVHLNPQECVSKVWFPPPWQ